MVLFKKNYFLARHIAGQGAVGLNISREARFKGNASLAPVAEVVPVADGGHGLDAHLVVPVDQVRAVVVAFAVKVPAASVAVLLHLEGESGVPALETVHQLVDVLVA